MGLASRINGLTKSRTWEEQFLDAMNQAIKEQNKPRPSKPNIKPSKTACLRMMYYILTDAPVDSKDSVSPDMSLIQKDGSDTHETIQDILAGAKPFGINYLDQRTELKLVAERGLDTYVTDSPSNKKGGHEIHCYNPTYGISFMFDGVIEFLEKKVIFELKTEDHFKYQKRFAPDPGHIEQATFYSACLGLEWVLFLYVNRNYRWRKPFLIHITEEMRREALNRVKIARYCATHNIVPCKEEGKCTYCQYKRTCKGHGNVTHVGQVDMAEVAATPWEDLVTYHYGREVIEEPTTEENKEGANDVTETP